MRALDRRFEGIVFDWDGTAVPDRQADASRLRKVLEALCAAGVDVGVVSGTHLANVDGQLGAPRPQGTLWLALNRGSQVFAVDAEGPRLLEQRDTTPDENRALDRAAALAVEQLAERGLRAEVVSGRLNRRKIDLIPEPAGQDPPKAEIDRLLAAVEARLAAAGIDGLPEVVAVAAAAARDDQPPRRIEPPGTRLLSTGRATLGREEHP